MFYYKQILLEAKHMMSVRFVRIYEMSEFFEIQKLNS